jgi:hypothetical protein
MTTMSEGGRCLDRAGPPPQGPTSPAGPAGRADEPTPRPPGLRELYNVALPLRGAENRQFLNGLADRLVVMAGVAAVVGYGYAGLIGAAVGLVLGLVGSGRAVVRGRFWRCPGRPQASLRVEDGGAAPRGGPSLSFSHRRANLQWSPRPGSVSV